MLPEFSTPTGESEEEYLKELCRHGWAKLLLETGKVDNEEDKNKYLDRFVEEFRVIKEANLFGYFLIVRDIISFVNSKGWLSGPGRGSAAGCLISYLVGITKIDPIQYDLLFERFYNSGRNTDDHVSLPDIDIDVPGNKRDEIISYLKDTYGKYNVSQMLTFGRLQGRSAIKEILRINEACSFGEMNEISKSIPNEADVSDQLQAMDEEDRSIIKFALIDNPEELRDYCHVTEKGNLEGDYAEYFEQAIRIEGTFKTQGKHAAGVVISSDRLYNVCPMVNQKSGSEKIAGLEMADLESLGHVKFDVLGINLLDKIMKIEELIDVV
jgi:DNA polymerase-3 subunit alpha